METITVGSSDNIGKFGYDISDNTLFIEISDDNNNTKRSIWVSRHDALKIVKHILMTNGITKIKNSIDFE